MQWIKKLAGAALCAWSALQETALVRFLDWVGRITASQEIINYVRERVVMPASPVAHLISLALFVLGLVLLAPDKWRATLARNKKVFSLYGMIFSGACFAASVIWHFWPLQRIDTVNPIATEKETEQSPISSPTATKMESTSGPYLETYAEGRITARGATIPGDLTNRFASSGGGGLIDLDGAKITRDSSGGLHIDPPTGPINVVFPKPSGLLRTLEDSEIEARAAKLSSLVQDFSRDFGDAEQKFNAETKYSSTDEQYMSFYKIWKVKYFKTIYPYVFEILCEYTNRGKIIYLTDVRQYYAAKLLIDKAFGGYMAISEISLLLNTISSIDGNH